MKETENDLGPAIRLFCLLGAFTVVVLLVSLSGLDGVARGIVLLGLAALQATAVLVLLLGVRDHRPFLRGILLLTLFLLVGLLVGPVLTVETAPVEVGSFGMSPSEDREVDE